MSDTLLATMDVEQATKLLGHVDRDVALQAGILAPMAGTRPIRIFSLDEAERFLVITVDTDVMSTGGSNFSTINYVEPAHLAKWIDEVLGDHELGTAISELAATREPYGFLVPKMKAIIASRIAQANQVLGVVDVATQ